MKIILIITMRRGRNQEGLWDVELPRFRGLSQRTLCTTRLGLGAWKRTGAYFKGAFHHAYILEVTERPCPLKWYRLNSKLGYHSPQTGHRGLRKFLAQR